jgi:hypothetical protein
MRWVIFAGQFNVGKMPTGAVRFAVSICNCKREVLLDKAARRFSPRQPDFAPIRTCFAAREKKDRNKSSGPCCFFAAKRRAQRAAVSEAQPTKAFSIT